MIQKGRMYTWKGYSCVVTRVARNQTWADIKVFGPRSDQPLWGKRQPLPLDDNFERVS